MKSVGPLTKSFSPENEQIELACVVSLGVPGLPMLPGGPITSPANAAPALAPATATAHSAAANIDFFRSIALSPSKWTPFFGARPDNVQRWRHAGQRGVSRSGARPVDHPDRSVLLWSRSAPPIANSSSPVYVRLVEKCGVRTGVRKRRTFLAPPTRLTTDLSQIRLTSAQKGPYGARTPLQIVIKSVSWSHRGTLRMGCPDTYAQ